MIPKKIPSASTTVGTETTTSTFGATDKAARAAREPSSRRGLILRVGGVAEVDEPAPQVGVHALAPTIGFSGGPSPMLGQSERVGLLPAHAAVRADQLLERGDLVGLGPVGAVDDDVGAVRRSRRCA